MNVELEEGQNFVLQPNPKPLKIELLAIKDDGAVQLLVKEVNE